MKSLPITPDPSIVNNDTNQHNLPILRRSAVALLGRVLLDLFPQTLLIEGVETEIGFRIHFFCPQPIDNQAIVLIEERFRTLAKKNDPVRSVEMMRENAATLLVHQGQPELAELALEMEDQVIDLIQIDQFYFPCNAPHVLNTSELIATKLFNISLVSEEGSLKEYCIEGTVLPENQALKKFLKRIEAAKKKDHQVIGVDMGLFFEEQDQWYWQPKGVILKQLLIDWCRQQQIEQQFLPVSTPVNDLTVVQRHGILFSHAQFTQRDLPIKYCEWIQQSPVNSHREAVGLYHSTPSEADQNTIFCRADQVSGLLISSLQFIERIARIFRFEHRIIFCPGAKSDQGGAALAKALELSGVVYHTELPTHEKSPAKVESRLVDPIGREWPASHVAAISDRPTADKLHYIDSNGRQQKPWIISCSLFGAIESVIAHLIEKDEGQMPLWLAPEQVRLVPLSDQYGKYADQIADRLCQLQYRVGRDRSNELLSAKIYSAVKAKVPYLVIVGDQEEKRKLITLRESGSDGKSTSMTLEALIDRLKTELEHGKTI